MRKIVYMFVFLMLLVSIAGFAIAESGSSNNETDDSGSDSESDLDDSDEDLNETDDSGSDSESDLDDSDEDLNETDDSDDNNMRERLREKMKDGKLEIEYKFRNGSERIEYKLKMENGELKEEFRDKLRDIRLRIRDRNVSFNYTDDDKLEFMVGKINTRTGLNLTIDQIDNVTLGQVMRAYLSNGRWAEIKVMPDSASEIALDRLRAKCEDRNCTVELRELHNNRTNQTRLAYQIDTEKDSRLFFLFKKKMKLSAEVDAETGEIISERKPWWAFLARENDDRDKSDDNDDNDNDLNETDDSGSDSESDLDDSDEDLNQTSTNSTLTNSSS